MVSLPLTVSFLLVFFKNLRTLIVSIAICYLKSISSKSSGLIYCKTSLSSCGLFNLLVRKAHITASLKLSIVVELTVAMFCVFVLELDVPLTSDHNLWDIIVDGDLQEEVAPAGEQSSPPSPKTAKQLIAKRNQERVKSIFLLVIPDEYLLKFHNVPDAKSLWAAIKSRFGGYDESKKMQRDV
ncbi:hypothetical protein Tco_1239029 [Tanacetum coccineum]